MKTLVFISLLASLAALLMVIRIRQEERSKAKKAVSLLVSAIDKELAK